MRNPATVTSADSRNGILQPQETNESRGRRAANGMKIIAATIWPSWAPCRVTAARLPRSPVGVCSMIMVEDPEISPATAKPWTSRHVTRMTGAMTPIWR